MESIVTDSRPFSQMALATDSQPNKPDYLTLREADVLHLVARGKTDEFIAQQLHLAPRTVRYNIQTVCERFEVNSRIEAVVKAVRLKLI